MKKIKFLSLIMLIFVLLFSFSSVQTRAFETSSVLTDEEEVIDDGLTIAELLEDLAEIYDIIQEYGPASLEPLIEKFNNEDLGGRLIQSTEDLEDNMKKLSLESIEEIIAKTNVLKESCQDILPTNPSLQAEVDAELAKFDEAVAEAKAACEQLEITGKYILDLCVEFSEFVHSYSFNKNSDSDAEVVKTNSELKLPDYISGVLSRIEELIDTYILMAKDINDIECSINLVKFRSNRLVAYFDSIYKINSKTNIYYTLILAKDVDASVDEFIEIINSTSINLLKDFAYEYNSATNTFIDPENVSYVVGFGDSTATGVGNRVVKEDSYVKLYANALGLSEGKYKNLALTGYRLEDVLYFLDETSFPKGTDDYNKKLFPKYDEISKEFIAEVKKADVITLGFNDLDFAFAQMKCAATASPYYEIEWERILNEDGINAVKELLALVNENIAAKVAGREEMISVFMESYLYNYLSSRFYFADLVKTIQKLNPDVKIVSVGSYNPFYNLSFGEGEDALDIGELINSFIAGTDLFTITDTMILDNVIHVKNPHVTTFFEETGVFDLITYIYAIGTKQIQFNPSATGHQEIAQRIIGMTNINHVCEPSNSIPDCSIVADCKICGQVLEEASKHTYGNICDTTCNNSGCEYIRITNHYVEKDDNDCTTSLKCAGCGVEIPAQESHNYPFDCSTHCINPGCLVTREDALCAHDLPEDDFDCSTALTCRVCLENVVEASKHTYTNSCDADCNNPGCNFVRVPTHLVTPDEHYSCTSAITCSRCQEVIKEASEHEFTYECDPTCNNPGCTYTRSWVTHKPNSDNDCTTAELCVYCYKVLTPSKEHVFDESNCEDITCNNPGCNYKRELVHTYEEDDHNCTTELKCTTCGKVIVNAYRNHIYDNSCDPICNIEGCNFTREIHHIPEPDDYLCHTETKCSICGEVTTHATVHEFDKCNSKCSNCTFTRVVDHVYGGWEVVEEPTEHESGLRQKTCIICGEVETLEIDKLAKEGMPLALIIIIVVVITAGTCVLCFWLFFKKGLMKKILHSITTKKLVVISVIGVIAIACAISSRFVAVNYSLSDYLPDDSSTAIAIEIMEDEFGLNSNIQVMVQNIDKEEAKAMAQRLGQLENVVQVSYNEDSPLSYKDNTALFNIMAVGDEYSETAINLKDNVINVLKTEYPQYTINYGGNIVEKSFLKDAITDELPLILIISISIVLIILVLTSSSWIEPIIFLASAGVGVVINKGTNIFLGEISYITDSVAAILQLALSIDYSIVMLHTYHKFKEHYATKEEAMKKAIIECIKPVSCSALTTIAGLLALFFMSFTIGFDIGMVLTKGIVISFLMSFILMPTLILFFDKLMNKTRKKPITVGASGFTKVVKSKGKFYLVGIAILLIIASVILQANTNYAFTDKRPENPIAEKFGNDNTLILVYENVIDAEAKEQEFIDMLNSSELKTLLGRDDDVVRKVTRYYNTVGEAYDIVKAAKTLNMSENEVAQLFGLYKILNDNNSLTMSTNEFLTVAYNLVISDDPDVKNVIDQNTIDLIKRLKNIFDMADSNLTYQEFVIKLEEETADENEKGLDEFSMLQMYRLYHAQNNNTLDKANFTSMVEFLLNSAKTNPTVMEMVTTERYELLKSLNDGISFVNKSFATIQKDFETLVTREDLKANLGKDDSEIDAIFTDYLINNNLNPETESVKQGYLMKYLCDTNVITDETYIDQYTTTYNYYMVKPKLDELYTFEEFGPALYEIGGYFKDIESSDTIDSAAFEQVYLMYFYQDKIDLTNEKVKGIDFVNFLLEESKTNSIIDKPLSRNDEMLRKKLTDMTKLYYTFNQEEKLSYLGVHQEIMNLIGEVESMSIEKPMSADKILGVYVKYLTSNNLLDNERIIAIDLLDFVLRNMYSNELLYNKLAGDENLEKREKLYEAKELVSSAGDLFVGYEHSRILINVDLLDGTEESYKFIEYVTGETERIFEGKAYLAGQLMSTYDLKNSFESDQTFINIFTFISILLIVALTFRSLSVPVILTIIIEGAVFITMAILALSGFPVFFMSYIVATCILMGATIDYGILISSNYLNNRKAMDKIDSIKEALKVSLPSIMTSGLILVTAGFVISFISSQTSISNVGLLIGIGTSVSLLMVLFVIPCLLFILDKLVLKYTKH